MDERDDEPGGPDQRPAREWVRGLVVVVAFVAVVLVLPLVLYVYAALSQLRG